MTSLYKAVVLYLLVFIAICEAVGSNDYEVPTPTIEALYPRGFRVTLKDDGYTFVGFRGNINQEFQGLNEGVLHGDIPRPKGNKWVYRDRNVVLQVGDTIFYWMYIRRNGKGYYNTDLAYTVTGFVNEDGTPASAQAQIPPSPPTDEDTSVFFPENPIDPRYEFITMPSDCAASKTIVQGIPYICKDQLLFSEEFAITTSRGALDKWDVMTEFPGEPDYPFNVYIPDNTVSFDQDCLVITPVVVTESPNGFLDLADRCTGQAGTPECRREVAGAQTIPPVTTAKITTRSSFNFMFGKIEVRAKLPSGSWLLPEINLESSDNAYGPDNYESGLMRVAFVRGNSELAKKLYGGPVLSESDPFRSALLQEKIGIDNWHKDFHNYAMIWRPDGIDLLVDGEHYGTVNPNGGFFEAAKNYNVSHASRWQKGTVMAPLDKMFHITLGLRVGGVNDFSDDLENKPWRNGASKAMLDFWKSKDSWHHLWYDPSLRVDYVRVYAL